MTTKPVISIFPSAPVSRKMWLQSTVLTGILLLPLSAEAIDIPEVDPRPLELEVLAPRSNFIEYEQMQIEVVLRNAGLVPVPIAVPSASGGIRWISGCQLFLKPLYKNPSRSLAPTTDFHQPYVRNIPAKVEEAPWPPTEFYDGQSPHAVAWLPPGHKISWHENLLSTSNFGIYRDEELIGLKAQWLLGPGKWLESKNLDVNMQKTSINDGDVLFEKTLPSSVGSNGIVAKLIKLSSKEGTFLFYKGPSVLRLCQVNDDDKVEAEIDEDIPQLVVRFPGSSRSPVYLHLRMDRVSSKSWQRGSDKFHIPEPQPEMMSEEELQAVRQRLGIGSDAGGILSVGQPKPTTPSARPLTSKGGEHDDTFQGEKKAERESLWWWVALSAAVLVGLAVACKRLRGRKA